MKNQMELRVMLAILARLAPLLLLSLTLTCRSMYPVLYDRVLAEDGIVEWCQVLLFVASSIFFGLNATGGSQSARLFSAALALASIALVGEELSWGQRLFNFQTPSFLIPINVKGETTLHNLKGAGPLSRWLTILWGLWVVFSPRLVAHVKQPLCLLLIPSKDLLYYGLFPALYFITWKVLPEHSRALSTFAAHNTAGYPTTRNEQEWMELLVAAGVFLHALRLLPSHFPCTQHGLSTPARPSISPTSHLLPQSESQNE